jgi:hypothetical protein
MKRFIEGVDRSQFTLLPEYLDDWVDESNPVRVVDAFVDALDLESWVLMGSCPLVARVDSFELGTVHRHARPSCAR